MIRALVHGLAWGAVAAGAARAAAAPRTEDAVPVPPAPAPAPAPARSASRGLAQFATWLIVGVFCGTLALVAAPRFAGMTSLTVLSGSMEPVLSTGDVVIGKRVPMSDVHAGDVITFTDPERRGSTITHRVRGVELANGRASVVTQGDANSGQERWVSDADGEVARVVLRIPAVGYVTTWAGTRDGRLALVAIPAGLLVLLELFGLRAAWRVPRPEPVRAEPELS